MEKQMTDRRIFVGARTCAPDVIGFGGVQFETASTMAGTGFSCYPPLGLTQHSLIRITRRMRRNHTSSGLTEEEIITQVCCLPIVGDIPFSFASRVAI